MKQLLSNILGQPVWTNGTDIILGNRPKNSSGSPVAKTWRPARCEDVKNYQMLNSLIPAGPRSYGIRMSMVKDKLKAAVPGHKWFWE